MKITATLALLMAMVLLPCTVRAHGPAVYVPAGAGHPASQPAPAPRPVPKPRVRGGGVTSRGGASGGATQTPGKGHGHTPTRLKNKRSFNDRTTRALLGAVVLEWQAGFLPKQRRAGYESREYSIDQAVRGLGGDSAWALENRPTMVMLYDPSSTPDMLFISALDDHPRFVAASYYFNLVRVDIRTIEDDDKKKKHKRGQRLVVYNTAGYRKSTIQGPVSAASVVKKLQAVIRDDYGRSGKEAIRDMEDVLARKAVLKNQLKLQEARLIDPRTGRRNQGVSDRLRRIRRELRAIDAERKALVARKR